MPKSRGLGAHTKKPPTWTWHQMDFARFHHPQNITDNIHAPTPIFARHVSFIRVNVSVVFQQHHLLASPLPSTVSPAPTTSQASSRSSTPTITHSPTSTNRSRKELLWHCLLNSRPHIPHLITSTNPIHNSPTRPIIYILHLAIAEFFGVRLVVFPVFDNLPHLLTPHSLTQPATPKPLLHSLTKMTELRTRVSTARAPHLLPLRSYCPFL